MATRYWVGGGSSANWNATAPTNWSATSGGANDASVPTSVDDVIFDGAGATGNTNSTISATITVLSLNITTGYTATMTHNAVLTIAGNWTYTGGYTIAGSSGITISAASTITSNGVTWTLPLTFTNTNTKTLSGNLSVSGLFTISGTTTINRTTSETVTLAGGMTINAGLSGTANISWTGGTWTQGATGYGIANNLTIAGNVTLSGVNTTISGGTLTYSSGTVTATGNTLNLGTCTVNLSGTSLNNVGIAGSATVTLTSNLLLDGTLTPGNPATVNRTVAETVTCNGLGFNGVNRVLLGTAKIILVGGTWAGHTGFSTNIRLHNDLDINGNVTITGTVTKAGGTITYLGGTVTTTGSTLCISSNAGTLVTNTLNTNGITWNNVYLSADGYAITTTLTSNLTINGLVTQGTTAIINRTTTETVTCAGGFSISGTLSGTANITWTGGSWSQSSTTYAINNNITIAGDVTLSGTNTSYGVGTFTYSSGTVTVTGNSFRIFDNCTLNTNGMAFNEINFGTGGTAKTVTLTSNLLLNGQIYCSTTNGGVFNRTTTETVTCNGIQVTALGSISGTALINLNGGTWTCLSTGGVTSDMTIGGNVTISGNVNYGTGTLTYSSGIVTTTASTLTLGTCTLNTNGISWNNVTLNSTTKIITLTSGLFVGGLLTNSGVSTINPTTGETITLGGGLTTNAILSGSATVIFTGGTWSGNGSSLISNTNISGSFTIGSNATYGGVATNALKYVSGSITVTNSTLTISGSCVLDIGAVNWDNLTFTGPATTASLSSSLYVSRSLSVNASRAFTSSLNTPSSWSCYTLTSTATTANVISLQSGSSYEVRNALILNTAVPTSNISVISNSSTVGAILTLNHGSTCNSCANFTRITASFGRPINSFNSIVTQCGNVYSYTNKGVTSYS